VAASSAAWGWFAAEAPVLAFAPVTSLPTGAGKKARGRSGEICFNSFAEGELHHYKPKSASIASNLLTFAPRVFRILHYFSCAAGEALLKCPKLVPIFFGAYFFDYY